MSRGTGSYPSDLARIPTGAGAAQGDPVGYTGPDDSTLMNAADAVTRMANPCVMDGTVRAFQVAWNSTSDSRFGSPKLSTDDKYGKNSSYALGQIAAYAGNIGAAPPACTSFVTPGGTPVSPPQPAPPPPPPPRPGPIAPSPPAPLASPTSGLPMWAKVLLGLIALAGVVMLFRHMKKGKSGGKKKLGGLRRRRIARRRRR